jgi:hypothetical protein
VSATKRDEFVWLGLSVVQRSPSVLSLVVGAVSKLPSPLGCTCSPGGQFWVRELGSDILCLTQQEFLALHST